MDTRKKIIGATVSFGAIYIPVDVTKAHGRETNDLRTLHEKCEHPISKKNYCETCGELADTTLKAVQIAKDTFVPIDQDELAKFAAGRNRVIELRKFVPANTVPQLLVEKMYHLAPNYTLIQPYQLLVAALKKTKRAGIGSASLWGTEKPVAITVEGNSLVLKMLFCNDEYLPPIILDTPKIKPEAVTLAAEFISLGAGELLPEDLVSESRQRAHTYIQHVIAGSELTIPTDPGEPEPTVDLMAALKGMVA